MEYILSMLLGWVASWLQTGTGKSFSRREKFLIALLASMVSGLAVTVVSILHTGNPSPEQLLSYIGVAFTASQTSFNMYFKNKI